MRHTGVALAVLAAANATWAKPAPVASRTLAQAPVPNEAHRVVVTEGDAKTAKFVNELEQEFKVSSVRGWFEGMSL